MTKDTLVIFGGGFVSYNVCKILKDEMKICLIARKPHQIDGINFYEIDTFLNKKSIEKALKHFDPNEYSSLNCVTKGGNRLKADSTEDYFNNIESFQNIVSVNKHCKRDMHIGSGSEYFERDDFYSKSKKVISKMIFSEIKGHTALALLRIYGSFGENELRTRFIRSCFENAMVGEPIVINDNIPFDFISMEDFCKCLKYVINDFGYPPILYECAYRGKPKKLKDVAQFINSLYGNKSDILVKNESNSSYCVPDSYEGYKISNSLVLDGLEKSLINIKENYYDRKG